MSRTPKALRFSSTDPQEKDGSEILLNQLRNKHTFDKIRQEIDQYRMDYLRNYEKYIDETNWMFEPKK